jgi:hypothetical protein
MVNAPILSVAASLLLATVMTFGDLVWAIFNVQHRVAYGVAHGAVMCLCIGAVIGARARRIAAGALAGPLIGVLAAGVFYALAPALRWSAMLPAWMLFWMLFAVLQQRLLRVESLTRALVRGTAAAILSGAAFYAISGIWTRHTPGGPNYAVNFASWCVAFLPGFLCLFAALRRATDISSQPSAIGHEL